MTEIWKDIDGFPNYEVSDQGRIRNKKTKIIRSLSPANNGYLHVDLYKNDNQKRHGYSKNVHRLVAETFLGKSTLHVNHKDGNKQNNCLTNLEYVTPGENLQHAYNTGLRKAPGEKTVKITETGETFRSITECATTINANVQNVSSCLNGKRNSCNGLHFELVNNKKETSNDFLYDYQADAVNRMFSGCILAAGVGTGKSRMSLYWYFKENGGSFINKDYIPMKQPKNLYIITTAMKRDSMEWVSELANYRMSDKPELNYYNNTIIIDSWNNIKKYVDVENSYFIFDEDRLVGSGAWVKAFYKIAKKNKWIILSATPGDTWSDYIPVFIANGFYKNKTEFTREHCIYSRYTKWPHIEKYINTGRLIRLRNKILIDVDYTRHTVPHHEDIYCSYNITKYKDVIRNRWDPYKNEPIQQASSLCYILRRIVNEDEDRIIKLLELLEDNPKVIIFYNFDYERLLLLHTLSEYTIDDEFFEIAEWSGHAHQPIPSIDIVTGKPVNRWIYLIQYTAGCEGINCIKTDTIIFFSQNYSYKVMTQAAGRIDRLNTPYKDLYYYHLKSRSGIDLAISKALSEKKKFNETKWVGNKF